MSDIVNLNSKRAEEAQDNTKWTIQDMLDESKNMVANEFPCNKAITILLNHDTVTAVYEHHRLVVNMTHTEVIALLQVLSMRLSREMGND